MQRKLVACGVAFALLFVTVTPSSAQLAVPAARFFGAITINGQNAPAGSVVAAYVGGALCGVTNGAGVYSGFQYFLDVDGGTAPCATPGNPVTFVVNGARANEFAAVPDVPGTAVQVNLTVNGGLPPFSVFSPSPFPVPPPPPTLPVTGPPSTVLFLQPVSILSISITFSWSPGPIPAAGFWVFAPNSFPQEQFVTGPSITIGNLLPGSNTCVTVLAANAAGFSPWSSWSCATTAATPAVAAPLPGSGGFAAPGIFMPGVGGLVPATVPGSCPGACVTFPPDSSCPPGYILVPWLRICVLVSARSLPAPSVAERSASMQA